MFFSPRIKKSTQKSTQIKNCELMHIEYPMIFFDILRTKGIIQKTI